MYLGIWRFVLITATLAALFAIYAVLARYVIHGRVTTDSLATSVAIHSGSADTIVHSQTYIRE